MILKPPHCPHCHSPDFSKFGTFFLKHSSKQIHRYICKKCDRTFSSRTFSPTYRQLKPYLNQFIYKDLISGVTQRRSARNNNCSRSTVHRKLVFLARMAREKHLKFKTTSLELLFDEMFTIENTKLKPLSIALAVTENYEILSIKVGRTPATGKLAQLSRKKYGFRPNESSKIIKTVLQEAKDRMVYAPQVIKSDAKPEYSDLVKKVFRKVPYEQHISGENKEKRREALFNLENKRIFDPLFAVNQRIAKLRADIRRLTRRSWCVTKSIRFLEDHLYLFIAANNNYKIV